MASNGKGLLDRSFGRVAGALRDDETLVVLAEYEALRQEILFRLGAQQNLLQYTVLVGGAPVPIIGFFTNFEPLGLREIVVPLSYLLLIPAILCLFLQLTYLKHHLYIHLLSLYIDKELSIRLTEDTADLARFPHKPGTAAHELQARIFAGWEIHLTQTMMDDTLSKGLAAVLGLAEGYFASAVGMFYVIAGCVVYSYILGTFPPLREHWLLAGVYLLVFASLLLATFSGLVLRRLIIKRRH